MPTYIRPARVDISDSGGGFAALAAAAAAIGAVTVFVWVHLALLAACAAVFVAVVGGFAVWTRRFRRLPVPRPAVVTTRPGRGVRAVTAPPKAIGGARVVAGLVVPVAEGEKVVR